MLSEMLANFAKKEVKPVELPAQATCPICHGLHMWRARCSTQWRCAKCSPPPMVEIVEEERGASNAQMMGALTKTAKTVVCSVKYCDYEQPGCAVCFGHGIHEINLSDGSFEDRCWCGALRRRVD